MVVNVFRYPVKSMLGESVPLVAVHPAGLHLDRSWAVIDAETNCVASAKHPAKWAKLLQLRARGDGDGVSVEFADGRRMRAGTTQTDAAVSEVVERRVRLSFRAPDETSVERTDPIAGQLFEHGAVTLADAVKVPYSPRDGRFVDFAAIHFVTVETLEAIGRRAEALRFRPNLVLDVPGDAFGEAVLIGQRVRVGEVVLEVLSPTPRCAVPTLAQNDLVTDRSVLRDVARLNRVDIDGSPYACVGAYARVVRPGVIGVGDEVQAV